ncbi:MAG: super-infection exclusion protein B [Candidatus Helarchaeota archaeon]
MTINWAEKVIENSSEIFDLIRSNFLTIILSLTIISWSVILLPDSVFGFLSISDIRSDYKSIVGTIAYISTIIFVLWIIFRMSSIIYSYLRSRFELPRLTVAECKRINKFIDEQSQTSEFFLTDGIVDRLIHKGFIYKANSNSNSAGEQDYHLYRWVYNYLQSNPKVIIDKLPNIEGE